MISRPYLAESACPLTEPKGLLNVHVEVLKYERITVRMGLTWSVLCGAKLGGGYGKMFLLIFVILRLQPRDMVKG